MTPDVGDELSRAGLPARRLLAPEPAKPRQFYVTGHFRDSEGSSFTLKVEAFDEADAKIKASILLLNTIPIVERAGERVNNMPEEDLPPVESIVDGKLEPER